MPVRILKAEVTETPADVSALRSTVAGILADVQQRGDFAVRDHERRFDRHDPVSYRVTTEEAESAAAATSIPRLLDCPPGMHLLSELCLPSLRDRHAFVPQPAIR